MTPSFQVTGVMLAFLHFLFKFFFSNSTTTVACKWIFFRNLFTVSAQRKVPEVRSGV